MLKGPCKQRWVPSQLVHKPSWLRKSVMGFGVANGSSRVSFAQGLIDTVLAQLWLGGCQWGQQQGGSGGPWQDNALMASAGGGSFAACAMLADLLQHSG